MVVWSQPDMVLMNHSREHDHTMPGMFLVPYVGDVVYVQLWCLTYVRMVEDWRLKHCFQQSY